MNSQLLLTTTADGRRVRSHRRHDATRLRCWQTCSDSWRLSPTIVANSVHTAAPTRFNSTVESRRRRRCVLLRPAVCNEVCNIFTVSAMLPAMDDVAAMCDAGVSSSHHHRYHDDDDHNQQQQQLLDSPAVYSVWMTSSSDITSTQQRSMPSCSYRPGSHHALTAADSTTAAPTSTSETHITKSGVRLLLYRGVGRGGSGGLGLPL